MCYNVCYRLIEARAVTKQLMQSIMTCLEEIKNIYTQQRSSVAQKQDIWLPYHVNQVHVAIVAVHPRIKRVLRDQQQTGLVAVLVAGMQRLAPKSRALRPMDCELCKYSCQLYSGLHLEINKIPTMRIDILSIFNLYSAADMSLFWPRNMLEQTKQAQWAFVQKWWHLASAFNDCWI